jgi:chemotaxis protein CheD
MAEIQNELPQIYLQLGEVHLARSPAMLRTVLGSCVGITLWNERLGLGALCHGVLPRCPRGMQAPEGYRYIDFAIRELARQFETLGAARAEIQTKLFGGADVLPVHPSSSGRATVGRQNCQSAIETLRQESLTVLASDLGGPVGRIIEFNTATGEVRLRRLTQDVPVPL